MSERAWIVVGFIGQGLFFSRFFVQWIASERAGKSVVPTAFWYFSLLGGTTLLCYALGRKDPVFVVGQSAGLLIYSRNLYFIRRDPKATAAAPVRKVDAAHESEASSESATSTSRSSSKLDP
jgi:lipid-A-disaccharide synthase-like uncharacterized protein